MLFLLEALQRPLPDQTGPAAHALKAPTGTPMPCAASDLGRPQTAGTHTSAPYAACTTRACRDLFYSLRRRRFPYDCECKQAQLVGVTNQRHLARDRK